MGNIFHTYALITSLYENSEDYLDCFWPIAISVLNKDVSSDLEKIQDQLNTSSNIDIPVHVLKTVMDRAYKKGFIEKNRAFTDKKDLYKLTPKGTRYLDSLQTPRDVDRQISALIEDARDFFSQNAMTVSHDDLYNLFLNFIGQNIAPLTEFLNTKDPIVDLTSETSTQNEILLVKYLQIAEKQKTECFQTFAKMLLGSVLSSIMHTEDPLQAQDIIYRRFQHCEIYLDANFLFSVLGLHHAELSNAAQELLALVKKHKCPLKVFDFTVSEACTVINEFVRDSKIFPSTVRIDSINSSLKIMGWTKSKAIEYIANIDETLRQNDISVVSTGIVLKNYIPSNAQHRQIMSTYKPNASQQVLNHDLAAIDRIRKIRRSPVRRIENAPAIFLSSDAALSRFDFREMGHKEDGTIAEVILDRLLTNILWLKDPHVKLSLSSVIAAHSRGLLVNRPIWEKFYSVLADLVKQGKTKESDIVALLYHTNIQEVLADLDDKDITAITSTFALEQIEKARQRINQDRDKAVEKVRSEKDAEFASQLKEEGFRHQSEVEQQWLATIQELRTNFRGSAARTAKRITVTTRILTSLVFAAVPSVSYLYTRDWATFERVTAIIVLLALVVTSGVSEFGKIWKTMENMITDVLYRKKIDESGIEKHIPK